MRSVLTRFSSPKKILLLLTEIDVNKRSLKLGVKKLMNLSNCKIKKYKAS